MTLGVPSTSGGAAGMPGMGFGMVGIGSGISGAMGPGDAAAAGMGSLMQGMGGMGSGMPGAMGLTGMNGFPDISGSPGMTKSPGIGNLGAGMGFPNQMSLLKGIFHGIFHEVETSSSLELLDSEPFCPLCCAFCPPMFSPVCGSLFLLIHRPSRQHEDGHRAIWVR